MELVLRNEGNFKTKIKIIGVGGAGGNAVNSMINANIQGVEFIVANTDAQDLEKSLASRRILIGAKTTQGLGTGGKPEIGQKSAIESIEEIDELLRDTDMLFIAAGMGGGTGTGAAPFIASRAKEFGILTLAIVSLPFDYEGRNRKENASYGIKEIQDTVDTLIVIPNNKIANIFGRLTLVEAFKRTDDVITNAAHAIADIVNRSGFINIDFADVRSVMKDAGYALLGIGMAEGEDRATRSAKAAIDNPLLSDIDLAGSKGLLINISAGSDFLMDEFDKINEIITAETGRLGNIFTGFSVDDKMQDGNIKVTIIATGLSPSEAVKSLQLTDVEHKQEEKPKSTVTDEWKDVMDRIKQSNPTKEPEIITETVNEMNQGPKVYTPHEFKQGDPPAFMKKYFN